jgi:hypothetical protein
MRRQKTDTPLGAAAGIFRAPWDRRFRSHRLRPRATRLAGFFLAAARIENSPSPLAAIRAFLIYRN